MRGASGSAVPALGTAEPCRVHCRWYVEPGTPYWFGASRAGRAWPQWMVTISRAWRGCGQARRPVGEHVYQPTNLRG